MKSSRTIRIETTLGELIRFMERNRETLLKFKRNERQLIVVYVLNDLLTRLNYRSHGIATKKR